MFSSFFIFRFSGLSRGNLLIFTFIVPFLLLLFRNSELISSLLGRSIINENYVMFNLDEESILRNLRIMSFRKNLGNFINNNDEDIINKVDELNKNVNINLVVLNIGNKSSISKSLENYLININKKVLIISSTKMSFKNNFIYREETVDNFNFVYFNNDIQYGAKFILKRFTDIF